MGAVGTHTLIQKITVGSAGSASVTFNSIPQTGYTDLKIVMSTRGGTAGSGDNILVSINGSSTTFTFKQLYGTGSAAGSVGGSYAAAGYSTNASSTASTFASTEIYFPGYTSSNYKSFSVDTVTENNATAATAAFTAGLWSTVSAITSLSFSQQYTGNFQQFSTFSLYGISTSSVPVSPTPQAQGGDIIVNDGTYWYHAFISTGAFVPNRALTADVLVVAGGGSGGPDGGGGGGAGGLVAYTSQSLPSGTSQTVTIGAGGSSWSNGVNSQFGSLTASVGGGKGGCSSSTLNGSSGGSGGGGGSYGSGTTTGGAATSGQGNAGGYGTK